MSKLFHIQRPVVGLDITSTGIKVMSIDPKRWLVLGYGSMDLDPNRLDKSIESGDSYLGSNLKTLINEKVLGHLGSNQVAVSVPTARTYVRTIVLPASTEKNLQEAVQLEAEQYIPVSVDVLTIDSQIIKRDRKEISVLMAAIPTGVLDNVIKAVESAGLEVVLVEPGISSVGRILSIVESKGLSSIIVDIGATSSDIAVLDRGFIQVTSSSTVGGNSFTIDISKKLGVELENAHQLKVLNGLNAGPKQAEIASALKDDLDKIVAEVRKVIRYYEERIDEKRKLDQVLIVGGGSNVPGIGEYFTNALMMPARVAHPWQKLDFGKLPTPPKQFWSRYVGVAGLASAKPGEF